MPWTNKHIKWLSKWKLLTTACGKPVQVFEFKHDISKTEVMSAWAKHFRNHYCDDKEIDELRDGYKMSRTEFLNIIKFPAGVVSGSGDKTGPATRSGDFSEILIADYLEFNLGYWVPRIRYEFKVNRNLSENGVDVIGMKRGKVPLPNDELIVFEVKASLTGKKPINRLQDAVKDSDKDERRLGESLNATRQRLRWKGKHVESEKIKRFQNLEDMPFKLVYGAAGVVTDSTYDDITMSLTDTSEHKNAGSLRLIIIKGKNMMSLAHDLYRRAADEAGV